MAQVIFILVQVKKKKNNIKSLNDKNINALDCINKLNIKTFKYNKSGGNNEPFDDSKYDDNSNIEHCGVVVEDIIDLCDNDNNCKTLLSHSIDKHKNGDLFFNYNHLFSLNIKATQELYSYVKTLENKILKLENIINTFIK